MNRRGEPRRASAFVGRSVVARGLRRSPLSDVYHSHETAPERSAHASRRGVAPRGGARAAAAPRTGRPPYACFAGGGAACACVVRCRRSTSDRSVFPTRPRNDPKNDSNLPSSSSLAGFTPEATE